MDRLVVVAGTTKTANVAGITAAGASRAARTRTPSIDAELCVYGEPVSASRLPTSPGGTPTPALVTRAATTAADVPVSVVDAGLGAPTVAPVIPTDGSTGGDVRTAKPVPDADRIVERCRTIGRRLPGDRLVIGETIPGGTTTALGVLAALGEPELVSSSLPDNPVETKRELVETGLAASDLGRGDCAGDPVAAVRCLGDPVLAGVYGLTVGARAAGRDVLLGGGTQLATVAAMLAHAGQRPPPVATTPFVARDESADIERLTTAVGTELRVTEPGFGEDHPATSGYLAGEAKEGVGMGGALAAAAEAGVAPATVRDRTIRLYDRLVERPADQQS